MRRILCTLALTLALFPTTRSLAQAEAPALLPDDAAWVVRVNLPALAESDFGKAMLKEVEMQRPEALEKLEALNETLGLDLLRGTGDAVLFGTGFERSDAHIAIDLGQHPGNLEGLLIAAPEYASETYGNMLIHSIRSDDAARFDPQAKRLYLAILEHPQSERWLLLASHKQPRVKAMVDQVRERRAVLTAQPLPADVFMQVAVNQRPPQLAQPGNPQSNIAAMLDGLTMTATAGERVTMTMEAQVIDALRARQVAQLAQGGIAAVQLAGADNPQAEQLALLLQHATVKHTEGETTVRVTLSLSAEELIALRPGRLDL
jgi:hypothetical protein